MRSTTRSEDPRVPPEANFVSQGEGTPVVLIHGLAASLHDWDALIPKLVEGGYATYALDMLGHGESPRPDRPLYRMDWLVDHFIAWMQALDLEQAPVLVGHSLGGYVALEYVRRFPNRVNALILVDPFYSNEQLPALLRLAYGHQAMGAFFMRRTPRWLIRSVIDITSLLMGHRTGGLHALSEPVRAQTALDYIRTAPAAYGVLKASLDLTPYLASIQVPTLVLWGEHDSTLPPASFAALVSKLPRAIGKSSATGHVPHQAEAEWFNEQVLAFLRSQATEQYGDHDRDRGRQRAGPMTERAAAGARADPRRD